MSKNRRSRREFLGMTGLGLAAGSLLRTNAFGETQSTEADPRHADLVVLNAKVYTVDSRMPKAEAFAVKGGKFAYVGNTAEAKAFIGGGTQTFDAKQMTIVPGFIDCHNHAEGDVLLYEVLVGNPYEVEFVTIASIIDKLRAKPQKTPPASGSMDISSTTLKSRISDCSTCMISTRFQRNIRYASIIAAATRRSTTAKRWGWLE